MEVWWIFLILISWHASNIFPSQKHHTSRTSRAGRTWVTSWKQLQDLIHKVKKLWESAGPLVKMTAKSIRISLFTRRISGASVLSGRCLHRWDFYKGAIQADNASAVQGRMKGHSLSSHLCSCARNKKRLSCFLNQLEVKLRSFQVIAGVSLYPSADKNWSVWLAR